MASSDQPDSTPTTPTETPRTTYTPTQVVDTKYPLIDNDPHFNRVISYARPSDWTCLIGGMIGGPAAYWLMEHYHPSGARRGAFAKGMRNASVISFFGAFFWFYKRSSYRFYGMKENSIEIDRDMREMVDKVKKGETLYGVSRLTPHMQAVASRQGRYSAVFIHVIPWMNFVNHNQHGIDTAKYYRQAEKELEEERSNGVKE